jgi:hypothetical protein
MEVITVGDLIKTLQKYPMDTPVFGYSDMDEGDFPVQIAELAHPRPRDKEYEAKFDSEWLQYHPYTGMAPYYCQGDSTVEEYWEQHGLCPILYLRLRNWEDN